MLISVDFKRVYKKPVVLLEVVSIFFAILVMGIITDNDCYPYSGKYKDGAQFEVAVSSMSLITSFFSIIFYILVDLEEIPNKYWVAKMGFTGVMVLLWFVASVVWSVYINQTEFEALTFCSESRAKATAVFSFFSLFVWMALLFFVFRTFKNSKS